MEQRTLAGTAAAGIVGGVLAGPLGAIGGMIFGGRKRHVSDITVACSLRGGQSFVLQGSYDLLSTLQGFQVSTQQDVAHHAGQLGVRPGHSKPELRNQSKSEDHQVTDTNSTYGNFINAYRRDVKNSPFVNDKEIIDILEKLSEMTHSDPQGSVADHQKTLAKQLGVPILDLNKLYADSESFERIFIRAKARCPSFSIDDLNEDVVNTVLKILSDIRFNSLSESWDEEKPLVMDELRKLQIDIRPLFITLSHSGLNVSHRENPFFIINGNILYVDPAIRMKRGPAKKGIASTDPAKAEERKRRKTDEVKNRIQQFTGQIEIGKIYEGTVAQISEFGATINLLPGIDGALHIGRIAHERVEKVSDYLTQGQIVKVKVMEIDKMGNVVLSMKALLDRPV